MQKTGISADIVSQIKQSRASRNNVIRSLAKDGDLKAKIISHVLSHGGDTADGESIFHDAIVTFVKTVMNKKEFNLASHHHAFLMGTAKNLWRNEIRKKQKHDHAPLDQADEKSTPDNSETLMIKGERGRLLVSILNLMTHNCKDVLLLWAGGYKMTKIATQLNIPSEGAARKKKSDCMKELYKYFADKPHLAHQLRTL